MAILFPRPFAFAVDDLGWNEGSDLSYETPRGPNRAGVKRNFDIRDYEAMVNAAKAVGVRVQCLFILSEMDRTNLLAKFPTTTWQRGEWDNSAKVNEEQRGIMKYVVEQSAYMEFGLHGTGHEYWAPGQPQKRAEWYNLFDRQPWPEQSLREHIQCFREIMAQYGITPEAGHSFPESFVPCAYSYYWNPTGDYSLGKLLTEAGVKFANTDFGQIPELNPPTEKNGGGFDFGTHVVNRINYGNPWYKLDCLPLAPLADQETDMIESHWPNWLAQDDFLQAEVTQRWVDYYRAVQQREDRYIAKNTEQFHSQWLYKKYTLISENSLGQVDIDNSAMPEEVYEKFAPGNLVVKVKLPEGEHVSSAALNGENILVYFEDGGFGFLYLPPLKKQKYVLTYGVGEYVMPVYVLHHGTSNIFKAVKDGNKMVIDLRVYGTQEIKIKSARPGTVSSNSDQLKVSQSSYDSATSFLTVTVQATDMQGVTACLEVAFNPF